MVTAVRVRRQWREINSRIRVGHARFSRPIRNERPRLCPPKLGQRQTSEVLANSAASTPPGNRRRKARVECFGPYGKSTRTRTGVHWPYSRLHGSDLARVNF